MNKKLILTSIFAISVVGSAYAGPTNTVTGAPEDGSYQADTTYTGAATVNELGVYENNSTAIANANYEDILYNISAGNYLAAGSEGTPTICPAGSYCGGLIDTLYSATENQGINACPTIDSATFTSAEGSSLVTGCYQEDTAMSSALLNPLTTEHLNTSKNTDGYINGVKYASATTVARRYATSTTTAGDWTALDESDIQITDLACNNGYHYKAGAPDLTSAIGNTEGINSVYADYNGSLVVFSGTSHDKDYWGFVDDTMDVFAVDYGDKGILTGKAFRSTQAGDNNDFTWTNPTILDTPTGELGTYCYCHLDGYTPVGGTKQSLSSVWMFENSISARGCTYNCVYYLHNVDDGNLRFRAALFGSVGSTLPTCEANTINITWGDTDAIDVTANNAGTATYGEDIRTPVKAQHKAGKRFTGWTFTKPTQN
ncbi:MAG: hypothetical protein MJ158_02785 [Alphaproteobacteria bacterium]|nr:hypothetical protein [Alphaproteobacteria bacterium]